MITERELKVFEAEAREEDLAALARGAMPVIYKYKSGHALPTPPGAAMTFVASESTTDRLGDTIEASGWELASFKLNPIFLWNHDHSIAPLATVPKVWVESRQLLATIKWDTEDPFAMEVKGKYERGFLKAVSVGFKPLEYEQSKTGGIHFLRQELLEISGVSIPAHPNALKKALASFAFLYPVPASGLSTLQGHIIENLERAKLLPGELGRKLTYQFEQALRELKKETPSGTREAMRRIDLATSLLKGHREEELKGLLEGLRSWRRLLEAETLSDWQAKMQYHNHVLADK